MHWILPKAILSEKSKTWNRVYGCYHLYKNKGEDRVMHTPPPLSLKRYIRNWWCWVVLVVSGEQEYSFITLKFGQIYYENKSIWNEILKAHHITLLKKGCRILGSCTELLMGLWFLCPLEAALRRTWQNGYCGPLISRPPVSLGAQACDGCLQVGFPLATMPSFQLAAVVPVMVVSMAVRVGGLRTWKTIALLKPPRITHVETEMRAGLQSLMKYWYFFIMVKNIKLENKTVEWLFYLWM